VTQTLLIGSTNPGKIAEYRRMLHGLDVRLVSPNDLHPVPPEPAEDATTYAANASHKAEAYAAATGLATVADDSGLEVDALGGAPGVRSARWSGQGAAANVRKLLDEMRDVADRRARFRCVLVLFDPARESAIGIVEGRCEGSIARAASGAGGFGYDPIFVPEGGARTMAELGDAEKDALSHRGRACRAMLPVLGSALRADPLAGGGGGMRE